MTTETFDPHAIIKKLAEAEWRCSDESLQSDISDAEALASGRRQIVGYHLNNCECGGTGRIVPFASLRIPCGGGPIPRLGGHYHGDLYDAGSYQPDCPGWVPEPDVEKAEYKVLILLTRYDIKRAQGVLADIGATGLRGLPLIAADAWLDEKMKEAPS